MNTALEEKQISTEDCEVLGLEVRRLRYLRVTSKRRAHNSTDHFRIFSNISDGSERKTPVGDLWTSRVNCETLTVS